MPLVAPRPRAAVSPPRLRAAVLPPRYHGPVELSVALIQTDAGADAEANVARAAELADVAATAGAQLIALPEYLQYHGSRRCSASAGGTAAERPASATP